MSNKFYGVYAVPCTPFDATGEVDEAILRRHLRFLLAEGVHGIIPTASTGEMAYLSADERKRVVDIVIEEVNGKVPVLVSSGACATREVIAYAQYAQRAGAVGVMIIPPYYGHLDDDEIYGHYAAVSDCIDLPIMVYNNPGASGSDLSPAMFERLAGSTRVAAVKESTGVMQRVAEIMMRCGDRIEVLCGCDTLPMEMFAMGVKGWVAAPSNVIPSQCVKLFKLMVEERDPAAAWQLYTQILPLFDMLEGTGQYVQLVKAGLYLRNMPVGLPRPPLQPPTAEQTAQLKGILDNILS